MNHLLSSVGLRNCKANCLAINPNPVEVNKNLPILNLSVIFLSIKPVIPGAPLTNAPAIAPSGLVADVPSKPHWFPVSLNIKGCLYKSKLNGSATSLYDLVPKLPLSFIPLGTFLNVPDLNWNKSSILLFWLYSFFRVVIFNPLLSVLLKVSTNDLPATVLKISLGKNKVVWCPEKPSGFVGLLLEPLKFGSENWDVLDNLSKSANIETLPPIGSLLSSLNIWIEPSLYLSLVFILPS